MNEKEYWPNFYVGWEDLGTVNKQEVYKHIKNGYFYHPHSSGDWVPVEGQGLDDRKRSLRKDHMILSKDDPFKVGDIVRLATGEAPIRIIHISKSGTFDGEYVNTNHTVSRRPLTHIVQYNQTNNTQEENNMTKLYEVKESDTAVAFATKLAVNSSGLWVMEEKGTGRVFTADPSIVEEVMPYTIDVMYTGTPDKKYSYFAPKGAFEKGQVFLMKNASMCMITGVDTKSTSGTKDFDPIIMLQSKTL
jgi:hypothetical protein